LFASGRVRQATERRRLRWNDDAGAVTILLAVGITAIIMIIALSVDISGTLRTRDRARALAEQAARAGAEQISLSSALGGSGTKLGSQVDVTAAACATLPSDAKCVGQAVLGPNTVSVKVTITYHSLLHSMVGTFPDFTETETGTAVLIPLPPP
jgi:Flp pilus assembly protein TadG